jgi:hypothetical protein
VLGMAAQSVGRGAQPPAEAGEVWAPLGPQAHELAVEQHQMSPERPRIAATSGNSSLQMRPGRERHAHGRARRGVAEAASRRTSPRPPSHHLWARTRCGRASVQ